MKLLRVLHIDSGRTWRGGQRQALLLALGLRDRGHEPFLIGSPESPLVQRARAAGLAVAAIPMLADWDVRAARKIRARMKTWSVDMIHAHDARSHALAMIALIGRRDIPLIVTRRVPFPPRSVRLKYGERVTRFIAISNAVRDAMTEGGIDRERITIVHSGVAARHMAVAPRDWKVELGWPADSIVCGVVGAMTAEKGIESLRAIVASLPDSTRRKTGIVLIGGAGRDLDLRGIRVHSAGFVTDIDPAVAGLDVLWHPARAEGLGTSVIDAMALGVPPVAFAVGGLLEVIEPGISGLLCGAGDIAAFAVAATSLIEDTGLRARLAAGARTRAKSFDAAEMTRGTEAVYQQVLQG